MLNHIFRLNPRYTLTAFKDLPAKYQEKFAFLKKRKGFYGLLHAHRAARLPVKAVNHDLARFLENLREPQVLKALLPDQALQKAQERFILRQLMDHVLEVREADAFVTGIKAVNRVLQKQEGIPWKDEEGFDAPYLQKLSDRAIFLTLRSPLSQPMDISCLLYRFNRLPVSLRWQRRIPDEPSLASFLGIHDDGSWTGMPGAVRPRPVRLTGKPEDDWFEQYWRIWNLGDRMTGPDVPAYKVYFSPLPEDMPSVFKLVRREAPRSEAHAMKTARTLPGLLRPDKLFVYFSEYSQAIEFSRRMHPALEAFRPHGVPFTHPVVPGNPLVSLGVDPPSGFIERGSWRSYVTGKLALGLVDIHRTKPDDPMAYLHTYMKMIGIDSRRWRPLDEKWRLKFKIDDKKDNR